MPTGFEVYLDGDDAIVMPLTGAQWRQARQMLGAVGFSVPSLSTATRLPSFTVPRSVAEVAGLIDR